MAALEIIAEARDKYTVHKCSECTYRKSCDMNEHGFDTSKCKDKRESIALARGVSYGYLTQLLDRIEAAVKREHEEAATTINALEDAVDCAIHSLNHFNEVGDGRIHFIDILCVSNAKAALQACLILYASKRERKAR